MHNFELRLKILIKYWAGVSIRFFLSRFTSARLPAFAERHSEPCSQRITKPNIKRGRLARTRASELRSQSIPAHLRGIDKAPRLTN